MGAVKFAVLGLNHGSKIARFAKENPEVELAAVAGFGDADIKIANELDVPIFSDYTLLFKQISLDAVYIALPNTLHVEAVERAIDAGVKHILLEKPIANTVEEGKHVIKLCEDAGVTLLIGHHRRSSSKYQFLRDIIDSGRLGKIVAIQSRYCIAKDEDCFDRDWYVTKGVGGPLLINAIHDFDDLNFVIGKSPVKVYAATRNTIRENEAEDSASVLIEYENGVTATYVVCDGTPSPWNYDLAADENELFVMSPGENSMQVFGTKGSFGFPNMDLYYYDDDAFGWTHELKHEHFDVELNIPLKAELEHFIDLCLGRETTPRCSGEEGLRTLKIVNGVFESAETGNAVYLQS